MGRSGQGFSSEPPSPHPLGLGAKRAQLVSSVVPRASRGDGSIDAPVRGEGVDRLALWHGSDAVPHPFRSSFQMKRGTRSLISRGNQADCRFRGSRARSTWLAPDGCIARDHCAAFARKQPRDLVRAPPRFSARDGVRQISKVNSQLLTCLIGVDMRSWGGITTETSVRIAQRCTRRMP